MAKDEKKTFVPKLRFPEFRKTKGWSITTLGSVLTEEGLTSDGKAEVHSVSLTKGVVPQIEHMGRSFSASDTSHYSLVRPFDVIYTKSPLAIFKLGIVKQHRGPHNAIVSPLYGVFTPVNRYVGQLIEAYFDSPSRSLNYLDPLCQKGAKNTIQISNSRFLSGQIYLPSEPAEQQKIASCLTSLDELIASQSRKVTWLQVHKRGLMQQLFPRDGDAQPRLRFPEFQDAGEWVRKRVDECGDVLAGKALAVNAPGILRPYLRTKNVLDGTIDLSDVLTMPMTDAEFSRFEILHKDILLNEGQSLELVGRASMYRGEFHERCAMQNQLLRFRAFSSTCPEFAEQVFRQCQRDGTFASIATKTTSVAHLGNSRFSALELAWPTFDEQQRIADCLSSLDAWTASESEKLATLKLHKQGLMQQLFPSPEDSQ